MISKSCKVHDKDIMGVIIIAHIIKEGGMDSVIDISRENWFGKLSSNTDWDCYP